MRVTDNRTMLAGVDGGDVEVLNGRLKTDVPPITVISTAFPSWSSKLRYEDMNASNGGVARGTSISPPNWVQLYNYSGSGYLSSFLLNLETRDEWAFRVVIDDEELFSPAGILSADMNGNSLYDLGDGSKTLNELESSIGLMFGNHDRIIFMGPSGYPLRFSSSIKLYLARVTGSLAKKFRAGLIVIQKES